MSALQRARDALQQDVLWQPKNAYRTVPYRTVPYRPHTVPYRPISVRYGLRTVPYRYGKFWAVPYRTVPYRTGTKPSEAALRRVALKLEHAIQNLDEQAMQQSLDAIELSVPCFRANSGFLRR